MATILARKGASGPSFQARVRLILKYWRPPKPATLLWRHSFGGTSRPRVHIALAAIQSTRHRLGVDCGGSLARASVSQICRSLKLNAFDLCLLFRKGQQPRGVGELESLQIEIDPELFDEIFL